MKKGTWVKFNIKGEWHNGLVIKGGKQITVAFGHEGNKYRKVTASPVHFTEIPAVRLDESGIMDAYEIKAYKEAGGEETVRFEAKLYKNGKHIAMVSNGGYGACDDYHPVGKANWESIEQYYEDCKQWAIYYGKEKPFEPESLWIEWVTTGKATGQSAKEYWNNYHQSMAKWTKK